MNPYCLRAAEMPRGMAMMICRMKVTSPRAKLYHTVLLNSSMTGTVQAQLSPQSPRMAVPIQVK